MFLGLTLCRPRPKLLLYLIKRQQLPNIDCVPCLQMKGYKEDPLIQLGLPSVKTGRSNDPAGLVRDNQGAAPSLSGYCTVLLL